MTSPTTPKDSVQPQARTDDLLASGADAQGGAEGFEGERDPQALQTGMEGIAGITAQQPERSTDSRQADTQTVQDNPGQVRNKQG